MYRDPRSTPRIALADTYVIDVRRNPAHAAAHTKELLTKLKCFIELTMRMIEKARKVTPISLRY